MKRTLSLKRERLAELSYGDLASVIAAGGLTPQVKTLPLDQCLFIQTSQNCCTASGSCR